MPIYDKNGDIEHWCWYDIFWNDEKKRLENPKNWLRNLYEMADEWDLPWFIMGKVYWLHDYIQWRRTPRGVTSTYIKPYKKKYVLRSEFDVEDFRPDGIGDVMYTDYDYKEFHSIENMLRFLKNNITYENKMKPKLDTVEEFCQEFGFEVYERTY